MLEIDGLVKRFRDVVAVDHMSFSVGDGNLVGFIGPNGAGKTTTMRAVLGLLKVDEGEVRWNGDRVTTTVRRRFGYMPEERGMYPRMRVLDEVVYFARLAGLPANEARASARRWLDRLGLGERGGDEVRALSHGNQQRAQLAIALAHDPDLLVLDEPFSGLDPIAAETMRALLAERAEDGAAVLFSSHQLDLVEELCRQVVIVDRGRVVASGSVDDLRAAQPTRTLEVAFAPARPTDHGERPSTSIGTPSDDAAVPAWAVGIPGVRRIGGQGDHHRLEVPADLDLGAVLHQARAQGEVIQFAFEPPDLSVVFRNAVGNDRPDSAFEPESESDVDPSRSWEERGRRGSRSHPRVPTSGRSRP